jgi:hypothetical protein
MNFKKRIETLKASTTSTAAIAVCNEALGKYNDYNHFSLSTKMFEKKSDRTRSRASSIQS